MLNRAIDWLIQPGTAVTAIGVAVAILIGSAIVYGSMMAVEASAATYDGTAQKMGWVPVRGSSSVHALRTPKGWLVMANGQALTYVPDAEGAWDIEPQGE